MGKVTAESYTLYTETGHWLGQVILTSDGMFASVTDYGNFSFSWRNYGSDEFKKFICQLNVDYFATKMATGMAYVVHGKKIDKACDLFAEKILPALQKVLRKELGIEPPTINNKQ
jgi:hypothetical protein